MPSTKNESKVGEHFATKGLSCFSHQQQSLFNSALLQAHWINTSSYYAIKARQALPAVIKPEQVALKASFMASGQTYGSRRLVKALRFQGFSIGRYRVRSMMKSAQLVPVWKRRFVRTTDSKHTGRIAPNLLQQNFKVTQVNTVWVADITPYRSTGQALYTYTNWLALLGCGDGFICP